MGDLGNQSTSEPWFPLSTKWGYSNNYQITNCQIYSTMDFKLTDNHRQGKEVNLWISIGQVIKILLEYMRSKFFIVSLFAVTHLSRVCSVVFQRLNCRL